jgi:hypothetical protein
LINIREDLTLQFWLASAQFSNVSTEAKISRCIRFQKPFKELTSSLIRALFRLAIAKDLGFLLNPKVTMLP